MQRSTRPWRLPTPPAKRRRAPTPSPPDRYLHVAAEERQQKLLLYDLSVIPADERMQILADALEDAGCAEESLLIHLRSPGPHLRGCWASDLVLGKG
jgi:hypothetical protein